MVTPVVILLLGVLVMAGRVGLLRVQAQQVAGLAARVAAVQDDTAVVDAIAATGFRLDAVQPPWPARRPGDLVTVTLSRDVTLGGLLPDDLTLSVSATALTQHPPTDVPTGSPGSP